MGGGFGAAVGVGVGVGVIVGAGVEVAVLVAVTVADGLATAVDAPPGLGSNNDSGFNASPLSDASERTSARLVAEITIASKATINAPMAILEFLSTFYLPPSHTYVTLLIGEKLPRPSYRVQQASFRKSKS